VEEVADYKRRQESEDHSFLQGQIAMKMTSSGGKDKEVHYPNKCTDMTKLDDGHKCG
jgi:hypothetical protein